MLGLPRNLRCPGRGPRCAATVGRHRPQESDAETPLGNPPADGLPEYRQLFLGLAVDTADHFLSARFALGKALLFGDARRDCVEYPAVEFATTLGIERWIRGVTMQALQNPRRGDAIDHIGTELNFDFAVVLLEHLQRDAQ